MALLLLLLLWAPLPVGSNRAWSEGLLVTAAAGVAALGAGGMLLRRRPVVVPRRLLAAALLVAGVLAWAWLQADPRLLPAAWSHPLWDRLGDAGLPAAPAAASLDPAVTRAGLLLPASCCLLFWLAFTLGQEDRFARILAAGVVAIAVGWAVLGLVRLLGGMNLLFYPDTPTHPGVTGNFPNRNHFATYVNLALLIVVARLCRRLLRPEARRLRLRTALSDAAAYLLEHRAAWFAAGVVLAVASLGSASRGGFLSLSLALVFLVMLVVRRSAVGVGRALLLPVTAGLLALVLVPTAGSALLERLRALNLDYISGDIEGPGRLAAWEVALRLMSQRPLLGHGHGTFAEVFPLLADERFVTFEAGRAVLVLYDHTHNIYIEAALGLGLPAMLASCLAVALAASLCLGWNANRHRPLPLAAAAGSVAVAVHGLVDFSVQIPAIAATYAVVLGIGCGQAVVGRREKLSATDASLSRSGMRPTHAGYGKLSTARTSESRATGLASCFTDE